MGEGFGLEGLARLVERSCRRAGFHSKVWISFWLLAILVCTVVVAMSRAPAGAYGVLLMVLVVMLSADVRSGPARRAMTEERSGEADVGGGRRGGARQ